MSKINGLDVKREITGYHPKGKERLALLSGFVRVCFSLIRRGSSAVDLGLDCQTPFVREYISSLMMEQFRITPITQKKPSAAEMISTSVAPSGSELMFADGYKLLEALYIKKHSDGFELDGINEMFLESEYARSYVRGVFLGCGSMSVPRGDDDINGKSSGYHIEFSFMNEELANDFIHFLITFNIYAHLTVKSEKYIVYIKTGGDISDCLVLIGAAKTVLALNEAMAALSLKGNVVRRMNCEMANINRTVDASVDVVKAISIIQEKVGLDGLDAKLRAAAQARLADTEAPISRIAEVLGISKSGVKHRFDKIIEIAEALEYDREDTENISIDNDT